jgi:hypothetical protein
MAGKREDRYPRLRTSGPGYETDNKEAFDTMVEFVFDYSDLDKASRQVKKELSDFSYDLSKAFNSTGNSRGKKDNLFYLTNKQIEPFIGGSRNPSESFNLLPDGVQMTSTLKGGVQQMGREGANTMRKYVNRIETGRMKDAITYNTRSYSNKYVVRIGWTQLWYKYFGFQENGTVKGIRPMHSIIRTYLEMLPRVQNYMSRFTRSYTRGTGDQYAGKGVKF